MSDPVRQQQLRITNLKLLGVDTTNPFELTRRLGGRDVYWKNLIGGLEPFGDTSARRIELAFGLPSGALDQIEGFTRAVRRAQEEQRPGTATPRKRRQRKGLLQDIAPAACT